MRIGIAISSANSVLPTWTTAHIALAALRAGHSVRVIEPWDFEVDAASQVVVRAHCFDPGPDAPVDRDQLCEALLQRRAPRRYVAVRSLEVLLLRINPLSTAVLTFAAIAEGLGVLVRNPPAAILRTAHKGYLATLDGVDRPRTMVSRSLGTLQAFAAEFRQGVVIKPARASGGRGIALVQADDVGGLEEALDEARTHGDGYVVAQEYLEAAEQGEKRLVWLDGRTLGGYLRRRAPGEFRHNLKRGGLPEACEVTAADRRLTEALTPHLRAAGVWLAGVDVIGERVVEVNTLNPGGLHLIQEFSGLDLALPVIRSLEAQVGPQPRTDRQTPDLN